MYYTCSSKGQITTLACASASGHTIPPMHVFPGIRFSYNPLEGSVDGAFFGKSDNGWITQELFNGWLTKHFVRCIPPERPICLLVDGHSSHIDLETSKSCRDNNIYLYCLPPHSSHITQPLDVGFFSPLKVAWKREVINYNSEHPGATVSKTSFARVFRKAYLSTVKADTLINAFRHAGIYPPNYLQIDQRKLQPSKVYEETGNKTKPFAPTANQLALQALEEEMNEETVTKYKIRLEEGYDMPDALYSAWKKLKEKSNRVALQDISNTVPPQQTTMQLTDILQVPTHDKQATQIQLRSIQGTPKFISSDEVIQFLEERKAKKEMEEKKKQERQQEKEERKKKKEEEAKEKEEKRKRKAEEKKRKEEEREEEKRRKEEEKKRKEEEKKEKARQKEEEQRRRAQGQRPKRAARKRKRKDEENEQQPTSVGSKQHESEETSAEECICPKCGDKYEEDCEIDETWIECETCCKWYHLNCAEVRETDYFVCYLCH